MNLLPPAATNSCAALDQRPPGLQKHHALFLDFDGTLVPIAPEPELVQVPAGLSRLLWSLREFLGGALALVSGRSIQDLDRLLAPYEGATSGLHGFERRITDGLVASGRNAASLTALRPRFRQFAETHPGILFEDKHASFALHYRKIPAKAATCIAFAERAARDTSHDLRVLKGKMVVELLPRAVNKGEAILAYLREPPFCGRTPVFVGDDITDEDGFRVVDKAGGLSVSVGPGPHGARHRLADVDAVLNWLRETLPL